ncbi:hypothetical protein BDW59DRAFT_37699 [Aspergillus cavernicola]|uniref:Secreted protein n=1 Tax=Aspergillus cavernicola TaxID=176166 RepID=A0ABR4IPK2_9EURO
MSRSRAVYVLPIMFQPCGVAARSVTVNRSAWLLRIVLPGLPWRHSFCILKNGWAHWIIICLFNEANSTTWTLNPRLSRLNQAPSFHHIWLLIGWNNT